MRKLKLFFAACALFIGGMTVSAQEDVTSTYLNNADLSTENSGWTYYSDAYKYQGWRTGSETLSAAVEFYAGWGSLEHTNFKFSQTPTLPAGDYRIAVNAFFREGNDGNGTNNGKAWIFAGTNKQNVYGLNAGGLNAWSSAGDDMSRAMAAFHDGQFSNAFDFSLSEETTIEIGFEGKFDAIRQWCILGPVKLYKYSLDDYLDDYDAKYDEAVTIKDKPMNADVKTALTAAMVDRSSFSLSSEVTAAIATLTTAINNANNSIGVYTSIISAIDSYATSAAALDAAGAAAYDASAIQAKYDNGTYETLDEARTELAAALLAATKAQTTAGSVWTGVITNPSFEDGFSGWTSNGLGAQTNTSFQLKDGNAYVESWQPNGTKSVKQTITGLPAGVYNLSVGVLARGVTSAKIYAAGVEKAITVGGNAYTESVEFACDANADIEIGFEGTGTGAGSSWLALDNFKLTLVSAGLPDVTAVTGNMNATIAAAQTSAIDAYNAEKTVANYNSAVNAIAAAQASVNAYVPMGNVITKIDAALTAATTATASDEAYQAIKTAYNNGTIADADILTQIAAAYDAIIPVFKSQKAASADFTLAIRNQSFEYGDLTGWTTSETSDDTGIRSTSNETYATSNSDGDYLFNTWSKGVVLQQSVTGLPNGEYTLTATIASDGATVYLLANGNHNDGTLTSDKTIGLATTITFLVKDGTATIGTVGGANDGSYIAEGYWWYKADNFRIVKNRDLTPEEMAVAPTAIALYNGETEVTEDVELTATANTVTLTPSYTPADASEGYITWASSDETVATVVDGVVTGVAPGTATITATSTLDANVSATATVTVSYPESTIPATYETIDGATKTVYTLAQTNLFKNGSFEYPNRVFGWKATNYSTDAVVSNFTFNANGGVNDGAYITTSAGGAGTATSIRQAAAVEAGKTYYFAVYTSGKAPSSNNFQYNALFKMSNATTENGVLKQFEWPQGADKTTSEWTKTEYVFTATAENPFVGVRMSWNSDSRFDEFVLAEVTETKTYDLSATAEDYAALQTAIEDAPALGFQANEAAPYNNITALNTLAAAKAIDPEGDNTHDDVVAATNALKEAKWTTNTEEVNAFFDGTFAKDYSHEGNVMPTGWHGVGDKDNATNVRLMWNNTSNQGLNATSSKQAAFLKYTGIYGNETGYTLPLKAGLYQLEFIYGGWNEQGTRTIKIYNDDNEATVTPSNVTALDNKAHTTESSWSTYKGYVEIPADGDYIFSFYRQNTTSQNQFVFSDIVLKKAVAEDVTIEETADYTPAEKYANVTFNRTLVEGWNGMVLPFDMSVDDVKATFNASKVKDFKSVTVTDGKATLDFEDANVVKAGKPFMMKADEAGTSYTISGVLLPAAELQTVSKESGDVKYTFTGSYAASTDLSNVVFALIQGDKYFYHNTGKPSSAKAFRAWFVNESTDEAGSRISFNFGDDVITGINEVQTNGQNAEAVYNLQGQRVVNTKKGLFIQNGKKVVIK